MTDEKPLQVRVAKALGWSHMVPGGIMLPGCYVGYPPSQPIIGEKVQVPRFERDWSATGPLLERFRISMDTDGSRVRCGHEPPCYWIARIYNMESACGRTPLIAVCNLILVLHAAGKLEKVS